MRAYVLLCNSALPQAAYPIQSQSGRLYHLVALIQCSGRPHLQGSMNICAEMRLKAATIEA